MSFLDVARGAYVRSPATLRRSLAPLVSLVPLGLKFGGTYRSWRTRIARGRLDPTFAAQQHVQSLRAVLQRAHARSPFYRDLIDRALGPGFDLSTIEPKSLRRLPVLSKETLRAAGEGVLTVPRQEADIGQTSGSNSEAPFEFYLDKDRSAREMAFVHDSWRRTGYTEGTAKIVLRGFGLDPRGMYISEWEPALNELRLSVFPMTVEDVSLYLDMIDERKVQYLYGYPSAIELLCRQMDRLKRRPKLPFKGILPISEPLYPHQRRTIAAVLGPIPVAHFYGLSEKTLFAREVDETNTYEFDPLYGLAELVDEGGAPVTEPGQEGRLVGTGFLGVSMPFVRYDTEDRATLVSLPSAENGQRLRVERLTPRRKPDYLIAADGSRVVTIDFTPEDPRHFDGIEEFQFYQDRPGRCTLRYITSAGGSIDDALRIASHLQRRTHNRITLDVEEVTMLATGRGGKRTYIDQRLDISNY